MNKSHKLFTDDIYFSVLGKNKRYLLNEEKELENVRSFILSFAKEIKESCGFKLDFDDLAYDFVCDSVMSKIESGQIKNSVYLSIKKEILYAFEVYCLKLTEG